ncbi:hypothetical protein BD413DRAFT_472091 [Trametes elegans]|nr:hypothetical protein BD413DRAFT_472091 [Trametes elegans]
MSAAAITTTSTAPTLAPLGIPGKPFALYPSSPLKVFPPPAPAIRRPLRERCGVSLTLHIESPAAPGAGLKPSKVPGPWSPKGHVQPHRNHLPRRRNAKPRFAYYTDKRAPPESPKPTPAATPAAIPTPKAEPVPSYEAKPPTEEPRLQAIIPALWVAFAQEDKEKEGGRTENAREHDGFTHVVEIHHAGDAAYASGSTEKLWDGRAQRLRLALPTSAAATAATTGAGAGGRAGLALSDAQLRAARDFVAECLPHAVASLPEQGTVRVLVTTPRGRPTDAMCVIGCYLAFVAGQGAEAILRCIDDEESVDSVWKSEVSGDEAERIEKIARSWSWLSAVARR